MSIKDTTDTGKTGRVASPLKRLVMQWIDVDCALPPHGKKVLAVYKNSHGNKRTITAERIFAFTEECRCEYDDCGCEYSDLKDGYYFPAGWYEICENYYDWPLMCPVVDGKITHWMAIPGEAFKMVNDYLNQFCENCLEENCEISLDGDCRAIRIYLHGRKYFKEVEA